MTIRDYGFNHARTYILIVLSVILVIIRLVADTIVIEPSPPPVEEAPGHDEVDAGNQNARAPLADKVAYDDQDNGLEAPADIERNIDDGLEVPADIEHNIDDGLKVLVADQRNMDDGLEVSERV
uniref:Uncharacterized protein n=1 Tax=Solanum tuberosum TaxID=4113 RepID=M1DUC4_SOLTU